jgi:hypothetical protein
MKNKKTYSSLLTIFLILIFIIIVSCIYISLNNLTKNNHNQDINNHDINIHIHNSKKKSIEIVISRYNEDLLWTTSAPFNKYKYIVYNKGDNENYNKTNVLRSYNIKNQGKCDHTYLYHIVHNYHHLSEIVVFLPGCLDVYFKYTKAKMLLELIDKYNQAYFIVDYETTTNILDEYYYFKVDDYKSMSQSNLEKNYDIQFRKSKIRPFGKWYTQHFDYDIKNITLFGIFSVNKKDIYNHDKLYYYKHMHSLEGAKNDELSHYYEKSWEAVLYPLKNTYLVKYTNSISNISCNLIIKYIKYYKDKYSMDLSNAPYSGPLFWNFIYFINKYTYFKYDIVKGGS